MSCSLTKNGPNIIKKNGLKHALEVYDPLEYGIRSFCDWVPILIKKGILNGNPDIALVLLQNLNVLSCDYQRCAFGIKDIGRDIYCICIVDVDISVLELREILLFNNLKALLKIKFFNTLLKQYNTFLMEAVD